MGRCGISAIDFWEMSPAEIQLAVVGWQEEKKERFENLIIHAWRTAAWASFTKKLEPIDKILKKLWKAKPKQLPRVEDTISEAKQLGLKGPWD